MYELKTAFQGMRGRKRDTSLLITVVALALVFITAASIFIASINDTERYYREHVYGGYMAAYYGATEREVKAIKKALSDENDIVCVTRDLGDCQTLGRVATIDESLEELVSFNMISGHMPTAENEIAIESGQLSAMVNPVSVGDTIAVKFEIDNFSISSSLAFDPEASTQTYSLTDKEMRERFEELCKESRKQKKPKEIPVTLYDEKHWVYNTAHHGFPLYKYNDEQLELIYTKFYKAQFALSNPGSDGMYTTTDLYGYKNANIRVLSNYFKQSIYGQSVDITLNLTVSGIYETCSDRWDAGVNTVPNSYVHESTGELLTGALSSVSDKLARTPRQDYSYNVFVKADDATEAYDALKAAYAGSSSVSGGTIGGKGEYDWKAIEHMAKTYYIRNRDFYDEFYLTVENFSSMSGFAAVYTSVQLTTDELTHKTIDQYIKSGRLFETVTHFESASVFCESRDDTSTAPTLLPWDEVITYLTKKFGVTSIDQLGNRMLVAANPEELVLFGSDASLYYNWETIDYLGKKFHIRSDYIPAWSGHVISMSTPDTTTHYYTPITDNMMFRAVQTVDSETYELLYMKNDHGLYQTGVLKLPNDDSPLPDEANTPYVDNSLPIRLNRYAYPENLTDSKAAMMTAIIAVIFATTVCAVFQIYLTQIKRRTRKLALMKAVGATNGQIASILLYEGIIVTLIALPIGVGLGLALSYGVLYLVNTIRATDPLMFSIDLPSVILGICACLAGLFLGMLVPLLVALKIPLRGSISAETSLETAEVRVKTSGGKRQTLASINKRHEKTNKGRTIVASALSCFVITILLISVFLGFRSFDTYRETVVQPNKPDYAIKLGYAVGSSTLQSIENEIMALSDTGITSVESYRVGEKVWLSHEDLVCTEDEPSSSDILNEFYSLLPTGSVQNFFSTAREESEEAAADAEDSEDGDTEDDDLAASSTSYGVKIPQSTVVAWDVESCDINGKNFLLDQSISIQVRPASRSTFGSAPQCSATVYLDNVLTPELNYPVAVPANTLLNIEGLYVTNAYAIARSAPTYDALVDAITEGSIDEEAFIKGEEVILMIPMSRMGTGSATVNSGMIQGMPFAQSASRLLKSTGRYDLSYSSSKASYYSSENVVDVGDEITIFGRKTSVSEHSASSAITENTATVAAIIRYFPDTAIWPFSNNVQPYTVICSTNMLSSIYPKNFSRLTAYQARTFLVMNELFYNGAAGETELYLYGDDISRDATDLPLLAYCRDNGFILSNYRETDTTVWRAALNTCLIIALLGIAAALIAFIILRSTVASAVEQESVRYGVLRAIGVDNKRFCRYQRNLGFKQGLLGAAVANLLLAVVILITTAISDAALGLSLSVVFKNAFVYMLDGYPWKLHIGVCVVYVLTMVLIYRLPVNKVLKKSPIDNIRA